MPPEASGYWLRPAVLQRWHCQSPLGYVRRLTAARKGPARAALEPICNADRHLTWIMAAKINFAHMSLPQHPTTIPLGLGDKECDTGHTMAFALCYRSHPERFHDVCTFCLRGWSTVAPSFGLEHRVLPASSSAALKKKICDGSHTTYP